MSIQTLMSKNKKLVPVVIIVVFILLAKVITSNPPTAKRGKPSAAPQISVDVKTLKKESYPVVIESYGTIRPRTQSILLPQVSGQIISIGKNFQAGEFFEKGDVLIELDDRDLLSEVKISQANLYSAKQALSEEEARVEQAKQDWLRLGNSDTAPDLVLRKPQLLAAQAKVLSAQASLEKAELAVERSKIVAPYTGRVLSKNVDLGQVISPSTQLAEIYAVDYVEIRLPLKNKDLRYMVLPENQRFKKATPDEQPAVTIYSDLTQRDTWFGKVVRTEGAFDQNSQQLFVVAQIDDPYGDNNMQSLPLKIGQYVSAKIKGRVLDDVITVANKAIYQGSYVYIVNDGVLERKEIEIEWQNEDVAIIKSGLNVNELLVMTPLGQVTSGTPVAISSFDGQKQTVKKKAKPGRNGQEKKHPSRKPNDKEKGAKS
ncbi:MULTISPECIES: efflux RND transporter periplasmic adaptor subunit [Thalassotalea]|uniref:Efflux RND transporter periplasmic adaptor subunit n=1 Tax=Thalassotalea castellviae TaxID=3075612 RepID=A0ABU2ZX25_9GAMM|nr:efflux RND transporter periplasmic adaptor subunit [Thalassotalea sp. W431]MDT0602090.1 efflux RND transporter periplasmic adaptor subunit [Thalassotalea sp. W431]